MALLKSKALQLEDELRELQQKNADACYAIIDGWHARDAKLRKKLPIITPTETPPGRVTEMDNTPFGYCYQALPSRNARTHKRWAEE
jgi:hypothetical protein